MFWVRYRNTPPEEPERELNVLLAPELAGELVQYLKQPDSGKCKVLLQNWESLKLFIEICHLWRHAPLGGILGLDWVQIEAYLRLIHCVFEPSSIFKIRVIEQAVVNELNVQR
ncbi:MAG: hypothetical protein BWK79_00150 [Beggiatoa sp. IS2]|nr:MAG: hypothetical protein BWK78_00040 [Thiotrichaceae bacterium IS1]OQW96065.1 MAG: hypothetical protein BWK79_00150 [Beggiatoa sp. IS2]